MLLVEDLHKSYGDLKALQGISFEVKEGDILGLLGPNGAGKSTTMRIVTGYIPADSGRVLVDGLDSMNNSLQVRQRIGYLPEHTPLYTDMRVAEFLMFRAHIKGVPRRERKNRVIEVMEKTQTTDRAQQIIGNLSKGFRQRVGIADALIGRPRLLILDEPTIGLDPLQVRQVRDLIKDLASERTVILSTHILAEVEMICNKVVIIHQGTTVAADKIASLIDNYDEYAVELTLERNGASVDELKTALSIDTVKAVSDSSNSWENPDKVISFRLTPKERKDIRPQLYDLAKTQSWKLLELRRERVSLEDVFTLLTQQHADKAADTKETEPTVKADDAVSEAQASKPEAAKEEAAPEKASEADAEPAKADVETDGKTDATASADSDSPGDGSEQAPEADKDSKKAKE
ncbi:MAG: ATP-binding cassette domain-containing protein [Planctomycetota bacterium]|nr:ATP-binding cassette domain-containing protein [Planctomycetota bacterium]